MIEHSESINELAVALAKAQAEMKGAVKDSLNPHFSSKYAALDSVWEACRPALTSHGLSVVQAPTAQGSTVGMTTMLLHTSGQWMRSTLHMVSRDASPQAIGSCCTYLRRYGLSSMVGIAPEDDDGNAAQGNTGGPVSRAERRDAARAEGARQAAEHGPYSERERAKAEGKAPTVIDKATGEVLSPPTAPAPGEEWLEPSWVEILARRAKLPPELQAVIPDDESMHAIPPGEAMDNIPFMVDAIVRKAKERKISPKEWVEIMERFFGSKRARLLNNQGTPVAKLSPFFVHALYLEFDMART